MTLKLNGTNSEAAPAYAGDDADTGLQCGTNELKLVTGGTARATVDSSGRLGLGTTSPSYTTHINSSGATSLGVTTSSGSSEPQILLEDTAASDYFALQKNGRALLFKPQGSEKCRITSDGLTFNGDTAAANALDDYEEGEFVPSVTGASGTVTLDAAIETLMYTKIGRQVTISGRIKFDSISGVTAPVRVGNFPFNCHGTASDQADFGLIHLTAHHFNYQSTAMGPLFVELAPGANSGHIFYVRDDASWTTPAISDYDSGQVYFHVNGTYFVN